MHILPLILFIVSSSLDNFIVGISYGVKKITINSFNNSLIALISGVGTLVSMLIGNVFSYYIPENFTKTLGAIVLIILSIYLFYDYLRNRLMQLSNAQIPLELKRTNIDSYEEVLHHPELADADKSSTIDYKEAVFLGLALSLNNMGLGIGISLIGFNPYAASILSFIFSLLFIKAGLIIGIKFFSSLLEDYASIVSILIIVALAIYTLFI